MTRRNMTRQTKKRLGIAVVLILIIGGLLMVQRKTPFDIFLTKDYTVVTKDEQIAYLKQHEAEMTDAMLDDKVKNVQWQWDTVKVGTIGNGTPQGAGTVLTINGKFNGIKDSSFTISFELENAKSFPSMNDMMLMQPLRINGGTDLYE